MRPSPEAVALAKARPNYIQNVSEWGEWAGAMRPYYDQAEETTACAAIRILAAERDALAKERDDYKEALVIANRSADDQMFQKREAERQRNAFLDALRAISVADWKTAGELRGMARIAAKGEAKP